jgi:thiamine-monophosphate kinase
MIASIAIPDDCHLDYLEAIYSGIKDLAARFDVNVLGGDTTRSKIDLIINIVVQGIVSKEKILCRDAARPGDRALFQKKRFYAAMPPGREM